jgi:hypothetical protein
VAVSLLGHSIPTKAAKDRSAVYYSQSGFGTLLKSVLAHNNPNENYYFVVDAPPSDKTGVKGRQWVNAPANIHPVYEFNRAAWSKMPGTWQQKGQEFRQEMTAAGLPANTMWAVNEASSGIRAKSPLARRQMEALVTGLASNGAGQPRDRGIVFQQGPGYVQGLGNEMKDNKFWNAMKQDVWRYMPETYVAPQRYLGWKTPQQQHYLFGADTGNARPMFGPLMSAFAGNAAYGTTHATLPEMRRFVAAQLAQVHAKGQDVYGMAWNEHPAGMSPAQLAALANTVVAKG